MKNITILTFVWLSLVLVHCKDMQQTSTKAVADEHIAYEEDIKPIIRDYCTTCHRGMQASAYLDLTKYENVKKAAEHGTLLKRIMDAENPMPQSGLMPRELRRKILLWAKNGFPQNRPAETSQAVEKPDTKSSYNWTPPTIAPININEKGFEFFESMKGHWVGKMNLMGMKYEWFAFDYRPIANNHIHGIFEGGSMGNLFTSFFVADFKGTRTIMARNGGVLQGIYRTSYFVLDKVEKRTTGTYYRLVDAYGSTDIMYMELIFNNGNLTFKSYTSRMGLNSPPKIHMTFNGSRQHPELAEEAALKFDYPKNENFKSFPKGLPMPNWGSEYPEVTSASFLAEGNPGDDILGLAKQAQDPITIADMPYIGELDVIIAQSDLIKDKKLEVYLSKDPLTDKDGKFIMEYGYLKQQVYDGILLFSELEPGVESFKFTYLHPGKYYITVVADVNKDMYASKGDISSASKIISILPNGKHSIDVSDISIQN